MNDIKDTDLPWRAKANRLIAKLSMKAYRAANSGKRGWGPVKSYRIPLVAQALVECLGKNDEERAKAIFVQLALTPEIANDF